MPRSLTLALLFVAACANPGLALRGRPAVPFDALVVPGCPSAPDGALSPCQARRAGWAALLYERGYASRIITSGGAVHSPYVEAEALAGALAALGVPEERIYLDPDALHTDENMYNALGIARRLGLRRLAVASERPQAVAGCQMIIDWGGACRALPLEHAPAVARLDRAGPALRALRGRPVPGDRWMPLGEREAQRAWFLGRRRPPSVLLYPVLGILRRGGRPWLPISLGPPAVISWHQAR